MKRIILITCLSLLWSSVVFGTELVGGKYLLPQFDIENDKVNIDFYDGVKDGCLPYPDRLKNVVEVELRRLGFKVVEEPDYLNGIKTVVVDILGFGAVTKSNKQTGCIVRTAFIMEIWRPVDVGSQHTKLPVPVWKAGGLNIAGDGNQIQSVLQEKVKAYVDDLYLHIMRTQENK